MFCIFQSEAPGPLSNTANGILQRQNLWSFHPEGCRKLQETL